LRAMRIPSSYLIEDHEDPFKLLEDHEDPFELLEDHEDPFEP